MIGDVIYPLNAILFGPGVYEAVLELSTLVWINPFWDAVSPYNLLFKVQDSVLGGGVGQGIYFQPSGDFFHHL